MKGKRLLLFLGIWVAIILVMLPTMSACAPEEEVVAPGEEVEEVEEVEEAEQPGIPVIKVVEALSTPPTYIVAVYWEDLMKMWDEALPNYKIDYDPHYGGEIFPGTQAIEALASGAIQMGGTMSGQSAGFEPRFKILDVPLLWTSRYHLRRFFETPEWQKVMRDHEAAGIHVLIDSVPSYWQWFYFYDKEVRTLEDMAGLRIRCQQTPPQIRAVELLGANPIAVAAAELTVAMQTHMFDGMVGCLSPPWIRMLGYLDYMKTALEFPITFTMLSKAVNTEWWYSLPEEVRQALEDLIPEWFDDYWEAYYQAELLDGMELVRNNIVTTTLSEAEFAKWDAVLKPLQDEVGDKIGHDLIEAALRVRIPGEAP